MIKEGSKKTVRCIGICFHKSTGNSPILHSNENRIEFPVEQTIKNCATSLALLTLSNIMSQTACSRCDFLFALTPITNRVSGAMASASH